MKMPSICVDFLKLRTAGENFVRAHRLNVADDALAHSCYALAVAFSAFLHHRRDCIPAQAIAVPLPEISACWIVDAHREGRRYFVHSDELLSAFLELEQTLL